jgi:hypothetical protein
VLSPYIATLGCNLLAWYEEKQYLVTLWTSLDKTKDGFWKDITLISSTL